ncbi:MAG TPA: class I SAM-dependent methyltransferase [Gemmatimonadales bacterium]|jgi:SAM-dependent methyltransferase|nr:class I SAM-dependent methyltransferase [Gemmatimonadales bacterium]
MSKGGVVGFPLRLGAASDFGRVGALFERAGFREESICRALGIPNISQIGKVAPAGLDLTTALGSAGLAALVRVFVFTQMVTRDDIAGVIDPADLAALEALDLLRPGPDGRCYSPAFVYPVAGFVIASDRHDSPDGSDVVLASDVVFPALDAGTLRFLGVIPRSPVRDALDLCAGTGIAALVLSPHVERVTAADITPRAAHFARFNALLNRRPNVEIAVGDLYEAVRGRTFDRIVAHPPYVPALEQSRVFRDGGDTGETILRRIVADLPRYLRPGGAFYCVAAAWDAAEGPIEARIRRWLGDGEREYDVIFAQQEEVAPDRLARWLADKAAPGDPGVRTQWEQRFSDAGLERNVYGAIVVQRAEAAAAGGREPVTARPRLSPRTDGACFEWALRWHRWRAKQEAGGLLTRALLDGRPRLGSRLRARVTYAPQDGALAVTEILLQSDRPFRSATGIEPWMLALVGEFGHGRTGREVYEAARQAGRFPEGFGPEDFGRLVAMMVERGYLEVDFSAA